MSTTKMGKFCVSFVRDTFLTYETVKVVQVPNTIIATIYRIIQLLTLCYIALYIVWYKKGYQQFQEPRGTSVIKLKGIARVTGNDSTQFFRAERGYLWDTADYQIPPLENNAFFLATRQLVTYNQEQTNCPSALDDKLFCNTTYKPCPKGEPTPNTFGFYTGNCVQSRQNLSITVCEINAWCPEELEKSIEYSANSVDVENFTVYIKSIVTFSLFNINMRNVRDLTNFSCRYDKVNDPHCPIYRIGDILDSLNINKVPLFREGGLIEIRQDWTCNFDLHRDKCFPKLKFSILQSGDDKNSPGVNYRSSEKTRINDTDYRILSKVYGLRFVIVISGTGGQFDIVNLFVAIGSGIGYMVIAEIVTNAIFMHAHKSRFRYREGKFSVCEVSSKRADSVESLVSNEESVHKRPKPAEKDDPSPPISVKL